MSPFLTIVSDCYAWLHENRKWVFSGIGVPIVFGILAQFWRKRVPKLPSGSQISVQATQSVVLSNSSFNGSIVLEAPHPHESAPSGNVEEDREELLKKMLARSHAFCAARWQAAGLDHDHARELAEDESIGAAAPDFQPSEQQPIVLVVGDFGSGKSLMAERLYQKAIRKFLPLRSAPIPVFAKADEFVGPSLQLVVERASRLGVPSRNGIAAIVDGADEAAGLSAWKLLQAGRVLLQEYPGSTLLATTRFDDTISGEPEVRNVPALPREEALRLINLAARGNYVNSSIFHSLPVPLLEAIGRPLFCIIYGSLLRANTVWSPKSEGEFLHELVERALKPLHDAAHSAREFLEELAMRSISSGDARIAMAEIHTEIDVERLCRTGLIVCTSHRIGISLPILKQWFGAQALLSGKVRVDQLLGDPKALQNWEYPIAVAAGQLTSAQGADFLKPVVGTYPEIAPAIIDKAAHEYDFGNPTALPPKEAGGVLRECLATWAAALGPLTHDIVPLTPDGRVRPIGVVADSTGLTAGFYAGRDPKADIVVFESWPALDEDWYCKSWTSVSGRGAWAWRWTLDHLRNKLNRHLQNRTFCTGCHPLNSELAWYTACVLTGAPMALTGAIPVTNIMDVLRFLSDNTVSFSRRSHVSRRVFPRLLREAVSEAVGDGKSEIVAPYATADQELGGFVWDGFSNDAVRDRAAKVFGTAICAYQVIVETHFPAFIKRMSLYNLLPARIVGNLSRLPSSDPLNACGPVVQWYVEPLSDGGRTLLDFDFRADQRFGDLEYLVQLCVERRPGMPWLDLRMEGRVFGCSPRRLAGA